MDLGEALVKKSPLEESDSSKYSDFSLVELWQSPHWLTCYWARRHLFFLQLR